MSEEKKWYLEGEQPSLRMWIFTQMALGAVYAGAVFFGVIAVILIIRAISYLLPEDPFAMIETTRQIATALV